MKRKNDYQIQVPVEHYRFDEYVTQERWNSYYHQIVLVNHVAKLLRKQHLKVLIIGVGERTVDTVLRNLGHRITTFDIDSALGADIIGVLPDVSARLVGKYDCVVCCEVLEHVKYIDAEKSLNQFSNIAPYAVISVPHKSLWLTISSKFWFFRTFKFIFSLPLFFLNHKFNGEHYWELGTKGYPIARFLKSLANSGFEILIQFRVAELPWHHFFLVRNKSKL